MSIGQFSIRGSTVLFVLTGFAGAASGYWGVQAGLRPYIDDLQPAPIEFEHLEPTLQDRGSVVAGLDGRHFEEASRQIHDQPDAKRPG